MSVTFHVATTSIHLGAFAELRKATFSFAISVRPSVHRTSHSHWTDFYEKLYLSLFRIFVQKIKVLIKSDRQEKRVLYMKTSLHFWSYLAQFSLKLEMFQTNFVEKIETHILYSITFFFENRGVYEIMWKKNVVEPGRPRMTIWRKRVICWISRVTNTNSEHVIRIAFPLQQWLHERASILRYNYIPYFVHLGISWTRVIKFTPRPDLPTVKNPHYPLNWMLVGCGSDLDASEIRTSLASIWNRDTVPR